MVRLPLQRFISSKSTTPIQQSRNPSPLRSPMESTLILRVNVVKGRNLAAKDRGGTSDPYLVVSLGSARDSTPTISKTLNPDWNVTFELPISGVPLLECVCWDRDRFGRDYMGEFDIPLEEIFAEGETQHQPTWYTLESKRRRGKKKEHIVSGEILIQFSLLDTANPNASPADTYRKFKSIVCAAEEDDDDTTLAAPDQDDNDKDEETSDETDDPTKPEIVEKRRRRLRIARLKRKSLAARAYQFSGASNGVQGVIFLEINKITNLPPEKNVTRTSFDMDPFVVTSLGRKTLRTRVVRHNLNPVYDEKMVFQVMKHEQSYTMRFTVVDRDKLSGNDLVATAELPLQTLIAAAPEADPETGLYKLQEPSRPPLQSQKSRFRLPMSRSNSATSLSKSSKPTLVSQSSNPSLITTQSSSDKSPPTPPTSVPSETTNSSLLDVPSVIPPKVEETTPPPQSSADGEDLKTYTIPLLLKNKERWEDKYSPELYIKAKYMPYKALRQQFWRVMLKQYDADDSGRLSKIELTTMLDTLGSTLKESTIDGFFSRFSAENESSEVNDLTYDQAVICLEDALQKVQKNNFGGIDSKLRNLVPSSLSSTDDRSPDNSSGADETIDAEGTNDQPQQLDLSEFPEGEQPSPGYGELAPDDLADDQGEEHVIEIGECPLCHQPRLSKRSDADIITHLATCVSQDWRQVDNLVMGGFVTSSQAQRKWYSKVVTKIGYGGYRLGANSANILVQDRITGQINEEKMSVYVRLGIRLLYKGIKSRDMEKKRIRKMLKSLSIKQGKKYDDPASASQIESFINFHRLDMSEVLEPVENFKTFNEFFYRKLKPGARPCSAPDEPKIVVSPADCRSVVFDRIEDATKIWIKGREFSIERLLGKAYPEDVARYKNGALGIFRLAPQDYHRFHIPVDGVLGTPKTIEGEYYTVNPMAIRSALDVYGENVRVLVPIDSVCHGRVMAVCVGAMMVGSTVITRKTGEKVTRAEELGYFAFGGSTVVLLFEPGKILFDSDLVDNSKGALETLVSAIKTKMHNTWKSLLTTSSVDRFVWACP
ncbi:phosphatidylserine decarboxylase Psd2, putative [Talaromyces stipitatus ATCC 10500]|uniref:Phosphatidylserine decarboxylase proenzyme 2 n=1 Tax=Talaromyces stipitatus (strain ATCC 10500 / CBS 375.48 / QM 6759 / NRRL 1006) TaxID=441959 RepID=B8M4W8_TALSN|nr:phosphatidylserine decarboxylase Psd2, putative [Talaromyces stipitatus ATCC 10500]EED19403.1 phosphatidylserine decarboxylase Psd2, putative [Talaromyces stipitatus ATCC 10500]